MSSRKGRMILARKDDSYLVFPRLSCRLTKFFPFTGLFSPIRTLRSYSMWYDSDSGVCTPLPRSLPCSSLVYAFFSTEGYGMSPCGLLSKDTSVYSVRLGMRLSARHSRAGQPVCFSSYIGVHLQTPHVDVRKPVPIPGLMLVTRVYCEIRSNPRLKV